MPPIINFLSKDDETEFMKVYIAISVDDFFLKPNCS